jgi:hypothetical protein
MAIPRKTKECEGDHGTLAIGEDPKIVHKWLTQFRLSGVKWRVTIRTGTCDMHHRKRKQSGAASCCPESLS